MNPEYYEHSVNKSSDLNSKTKKIICLTRKINKKYSFQFHYTGKIRSRLRTSAYQKLYDENRHLLNLKCDICTEVFETLEDARRHYPAEHGAKGYIKCSVENCNSKMSYRSEVVRHLYRHLSTEKFKYAQRRSQMIN